VPVIEAEELPRTSNSSGFGSFRHLFVRFLGSLWPAGPGPTDKTWAASWLLPGEQPLWVRMSGPDRRHSVAVARRTLSILGGPTEPDRALVAAALLHDVGKVESSLGTAGRAFVTALAMVAGRGRMATPPLSVTGESSLRRRVRLYLVHDTVGAALLSAAGSDRLTVAWAREHHLPRDRWTVPQPAADALKAADGD
jgi:HD domain